MRSPSRSNLVHMDDIRYYIQIQISDTVIQIDLYTVYIVCLIIHDLSVYPLLCEV